MASVVPVWWVPPCCTQVCAGLYWWLPLREEASPRYVSSPSMGLAPWSHLQHLLFGNLNAGTATASSEAARQIQHPLAPAYLGVGLSLRRGRV
jgi:hypothetical protein